MWMYCFFPVIAYLFSEWTTMKSFWYESCPVPWSIARRIFCQRWNSSWNVYSSKYLLLKIWQLAEGWAKFTPPTVSLKYFVVLSPQIKIIILLCRIDYLHELSVFRKLFLTFFFFLEIPSDINSVVEDVIVLCSDSKI